MCHRHQYLFQYAEVCLYIYYNYNYDLPICSGPLPVCYLVKTKTLIVSIDFLTITFSQHWQIINNSQNRGSPIPLGFAFRMDIYVRVFLNIIRRLCSLVIGTVPIS